VWDACAHTRWFRKLINHGTVFLLPLLESRNVIFPLCFQSHSKWFSFAPCLRNLGDFKNLLFTFANLMTCQVLKDLRVFFISNLVNLSFSLIYLHQEPFSTLYFFFHPPTLFPIVRNVDVKPSTRTYIYVLEAEFSQVVKNCRVFQQTVKGVFSEFLPKIKNVNQICQTIEI
jgi:hypothetical protein